MCRENKPYTLFYTNNTMENKHKVLGSDGKQQIALENLDEVMGYFGGQYGLEEGSNIPVLETDTAVPARRDKYETDEEFISAMIDTYIVSIYSKIGDNTEHQLHKEFLAWLSTYYDRRDWEKLRISFSKNKRTLYDPRVRENIRPIVLKAFRKQLGKPRGF